MSHCKFVFLGISLHIILDELFTHIHHLSFSCSWSSSRSHLLQGILEIIM